MRLLRRLKNGKNSFESLRHRMVEEQIVFRGIKSQQVISAMLKVPRHLFVPLSLRYEAYGDYPLPVGEGQTISQPYMVAEMTADLELKSEDKVLEIGTGSGYQSAVLAEIVKKVFTIEKIVSLANKAELLLQKLGYKNVFIEVGDGSQGLQAHAPYDGILVTAGAPQIPEPLFKQLKEEGRLIIPIGDRIFQTLTKVKKIKGKLIKEKLFDCMFVPLLGTYGWRNGSE
ncbi:protein-L-isoaspartate(D-aspartate) O-methyltransferase [candidate division WOR-3 bacterium]|nr:protein-L-isoaspartate(D-aspartate) O-methyltransferase [candidate division WOR-3 bacterium]